MGRETSAARRVAAVAADALSATSAQDAMRRVTAALVETVGADSALYHEFDEDGWGVIHATAPTDVWEALPIRGAPTAELRRLHPGVDLMCRDPEHDPFALTDIVSERAWTGYEFRDLLRPSCGKTLKMHISVATTATTCRGWSLTRDGSDYSRSDLEVAQALRPVLDVVARQYALAAPLPRLTACTVTERERVVLACVAEGLTAAAIGRRLAISPATVSKHLEHAYRKLDATDRVSAVRAAAALGLLDAPAPLAGRVPDQRAARPSGPLVDQSF
jgi:DNA-binding CsgD family transcriptional regulator